MIHIICFIHFCMPIHSPLSQNLTLVLPLPNRTLVDLSDYHRMYADVKCNGQFNYSVILGHRQMSFSMSHYGDHHVISSAAHRSSLPIVTSCESSITNVSTLLRSTVSMCYLTRYMARASRNAGRLHVPIWCLISSAHCHVPLQGSAWPHAGHFALISES